MSEKFLEDRSIIVFGGSSGIGRKIVAESAKAGAEVWVVTRNPDNFTKGMQQLTRREKLDVAALHIYPLVADIRDKKQMAEGVGEIKARGFQITDMISSQASGMDKFIDPLFRKHMDTITDLLGGEPDRRNPRPKTGRYRRKVGSYEAGFAGLESSGFC